jgi:hypothetical protein
MLIDEIYKLVQAMLNKDQLGYLSPMHFNLYVNNAVRKVYNDYLTEIRTAVRKSNWHLDGKNFAKYSEHVRQLLEYYSFVTVLTASNGLAALPGDIEWVEDVFTLPETNKPSNRIDKVSYSVLIDLDSSPKCSKIGTNLEIRPDTIVEFKLHYIRKFKPAKWTFQVFSNKPMFDPTANDFQDIDMPETAKDEIVSLTFEMAAIGIRELQLAQLANVEQQTDTQEQNID